MGSSISHAASSDDFGILNDGTPDMADDSVGAATQYVYDATAGTNVALTKMLTQLRKLQSLNDKFVSGSTRYSSGITNMVKAAQFHETRALSKSGLITNGVSDDNSAKMIANMMKSANKANDALIRSLKARQMFRIFVGNQNKAIRDLSRDLSSAAHKAYADISIAQKVCEGAKMTQKLSKSFVEKAERGHLARAAPQMNSAVNDIRSVMKSSSKIFPLKTVSPNQISPKQISVHLDSAYKHNLSAISHSENALKLTENARVREIVSARDELRFANANEQDALDILQTKTGRLLHSEIAPKFRSVNIHIQSKLVPAVKKFNLINRKVLDIIDANQAMRINSELTRKFTAKSEMSFSYIPPFETQRIKYIDFL